MLTEARVVGEACFHVFKDNEGVEHYFQITPEKYHELGVFGALPPSKEGLTHVLSYAENVYDTPSGEFEDEHYVVQGNGTLLVKLPNCFPVAVRASDIEDGVLREEMRETIETEFAQHADVLLAHAERLAIQRQKEQNAIDNTQE